MAKRTCGGCKTTPKGRKTVKVQQHKRRPPRNCGKKG